MIIHIPHLLSDSDLKQIQTLLATAVFEDGRLSAGVQAEAVKHNQEIKADDKNLSALNRIVMPRLTTHPEYLTSALPQCVAEPFYARYTEGMYYGEHTDDPVMGKDTRYRYRSDIAVTIFLNRPEEYDGGELVINALSATEAQTIKYPAGDAVLYPADTVHKIMPVTAGVRVVAITWVQSLIVDTRHRELLYQLVKVRDSLVRKAPTSTEAQRVGWIYSNLVRLWSTV